MEVEHVFSQIAHCVRDIGVPVFVLMRGLPGRGKSTFACRLRDLCIKASISAVAIAADDFMVDKSTGIYSYDKSSNGYCHSMCTSALVDAMMRRTEVVICHNTNTMGWESAPSRANAEDLGYLCYFCEVNYAWSSPGEVPESLRGSLVSVHGVDDEQIEAMRKRAQAIFPTYSALWTSYLNLPKSVREINEDLALKAISPPFSFKVLRFNRQIVHSTMEHSGKMNNSDDNNGLPDSSRINSANLDAIVSSVFRRHRVSVLGVFLSKAGIGAFIGPEKRTDIRHLLNQESGGQQALTGDFNEALPYFLYTGTGNERCPHITLAVFEGYSSKDIGTAGVAVLSSLSALSQFSLDGPDITSMFDRFITVDGHTVYLFSQSNQQCFDSVYGCNYGTSVNTYHKYQYFQWKYSSEFDKLTYIQLLNRTDVLCNKFLVPKEIMGDNWAIIDIKVKGSKGKSDDEVYSAEEFLRYHVPRGLSFLVGPDRSPTVVIKGLPKFTGSEDSLEDAIQSGDKSLYFRRTVSSNCRLLVTEKANGEAAHVSIYTNKNDGSVFIVSGSKNVHVITRWGHPRDIDLYVGERFSYAKDICNCFYEELDRLTEDQRAYFVSFMVENKLTAVFEYEDPSHQHVVPLFQKRLKFITFVSLANSFEEISISKARGMCALEPEESFKVVEKIGLHRVWSFSCPLSRKNELETSILLEKDFVFEGCVVYYIDTNMDVIGIEKVKSGSYICSRATREKFITFITHLLKCLEPFYKLQKNFDKLSQCQEKVRYISAFNSIRASLVNSVTKRVYGELDRFKSLLRARFDEILAEQVPLTTEEKESWLSKGFHLLERNANEFLQVFLGEFELWSGGVVADLNEIDDFGFSACALKSEAENMAIETQPSDAIKSDISASVVAVALVGELTSRRCKELQESFDELSDLYYNVESLRNKWPQIFLSVD